MLSPKPTAIIQGIQQTEGVICEFIKKSHRALFLQGLVKVKEGFIIRWQHVFINHAYFLDLGKKLEGGCETLNNLKASVDLDLIKLTNFNSQI